MADINRIKFNGTEDLASYWQVEHVAEAVARFDPGAAPTTVIEAIELHNVQVYIEAGLFPDSYSEAERGAAKALVPQVRTMVARFFSTIDQTNLKNLLLDIEFYYSSDLLQLFGQHKVFERCPAGVLLPALSAAKITLAEMLTCKQLVKAYDKELRAALLKDVLNAEHIIRKYLQSDRSSVMYLPKSLTPSDIGELLGRYVDDSSANLNLIRLIATSPIDAQMKIDAKLKLKAKRRSEQMSEDLFKENSGTKYGAGASIADEQDEPVKVEISGMEVRYTYSREWLDQTLDSASILNNFQHLFDFVDSSVILSLASYPAELGIFERFMSNTGRKDYHIGAAFHQKDMSSLVQTHLYLDYLSSNSVQLESVIAWFFETYLVDEFAAHNFTFAPSASTSSYLEKARHLFAEMEGLVNQFRLYVKDGQIDRELLELTSDPVAYTSIPSLLEGKYVYASANEEIHSVLHTLFSDQSRLRYINETLRGSTAAKLLAQNNVARHDFHEHQLGLIDNLTEFGVLEDTGTQVNIADPQLFSILHSLFMKQAVSYHRQSLAGRAQVDALEAKGAVIRKASLLTKAEASYFNYWLNKSEFSNGPELRNKYLHGSQASAESENEHFRTYLIALRLLVVLVIKINEEFCLFQVND